MMEESKRPDLWNGEMRGPSPADLAANGAHNARHGLHHFLGTLIGERQGGLRAFPPVSSISLIGKSHMSLHEANG